MLRCASCSNIVPEGQRDCPSCGRILSGEILDNSVLLGRLAEEFTRAVREDRKPDVEAYARAHPGVAERIRELFPALELLEGIADPGLRSGDGSTSPTAGVVPGSSAGGETRAAGFVAGTLLGGRYRIVGLLGKGGMGEVYRAEDLKLGQTVALKFLPERLAFDGAALARLHREVRLARQIAHANVCRVFDIGEIDGRHFLSMEYVDGEDLASLLRRIGRPQADKGIEIARQLCSGLAAAHNSDVLHRDLKPANVMIDGRGRVRITDFGLSRAAGELRGDEELAGTPAYMAPETMAGEGASSKSDVYALGLVLYEIFTGRRAFEGKTIAELARRHREGRPPRPSRIVHDIDPGIERLILRCLDTNAQERPTLQEIAVGLSRGDPVAAALAAGETPSPEMLAAAPGQGALSPALATGCLAAFLACLLLMLALSGRGLLLHEVPLELSPAVLGYRAREIAESLGYRESPRFSVFGFGVDNAVVDYVAAHDRSRGRWGSLRAGRPAAVYFWYREAAQPLVASSRRNVTLGDPPLDTPGMVTVLLDPRGRLIGFRAIPLLGVSPQSAAPDAGWQKLFKESGLTAADFRPVTPSDVPASVGERHVAWEGSFPEGARLPVRLEAAAFRGVPVYFSIAGAWSEQARTPGYVPDEGRAGFRQGAQSLPFFVFSFGVFLTTISASILLARRHLRSGRGDRRGAFRLALYLFISQMLAWACTADHVWASAEIDLFYTALAWAMYYAGVLWLLYLALEPYVRRRWPYRIISWSRLLSGKIRDGMVGRDVLVGAAGGAASALLIACSGFLSPLLGGLPDKPLPVGTEALLGTRHAFGQALAMQKEVISDPIYVLVVLLLFTAILRLERFAFVAAWLIFTFGVGKLLGVESGPSWLLVAIVVAGYLWTLGRFGLLAAASFQFFNYVLLNIPVSSNLSAWHSGTTAVALLLTIVPAVYAFRMSLAGRP